jgi:hypothetical protein
MVRALSDQVTAVAGQDVVTPPLVALGVPESTCLSGATATQKWPVRQRSLARTKTPVASTQRYGCASSGSHRLDQRLQQLGQLFVPRADRRLGNRPALSAVTRGRSGRVGRSRAGCPPARHTGRCGPRTGSLASSAVTRAPSDATSKPWRHGCDLRWRARFSKPIDVRHGNRRRANLDQR